MKYSITLFFSFLALLSASAWCGTTPVLPYYNIRSQAVDLARELAGDMHEINLFGIKQLYCRFSAAIQYSRSFDSQVIARSLFGDDADTQTTNNGAKITISGSRTINRDPSDWLADYFYLPTDFSSTLHFKPEIQNVIGDLSFYLNMDEWIDGFFFKAHAPITWTKWDLNFKEKKVTHGVNAYDQGYFTASAMPNDLLLNNFSEYASGQAPATFYDPTFTGTDVTFNGLFYAQIDNCSHSATRVADLNIIFGYNFINKKDYHLGIGLKAAAPSGNRPNGQLLFEPIVGNGGHWEFGAHITSHALIWRSRNENASVAFYCDANITHLFNARQFRTFDLNDKPMSRYMLAEKMVSPLKIGLVGGKADPFPPAPVIQTFPSFEPPSQFDVAFSPVANLTTQELSVSIAVQADVAAQLTYANGGLNVDLGYDFWTRSREKFSAEECPPCQKIFYIQGLPKLAPTFVENGWALKGDAHVLGFERNHAVTLSATESLATINAGTSLPATGVLNPTDAQLANPNIDNAQPAWSHFGNAPVEFFQIRPQGKRKLFNSTAFVAQTETSIEPILIQEQDFNHVTRPSSSHKIYANVSYNWPHYNHWTTYIGIGGFGEFGKNDLPCKIDCKKCCATSFEENSLYCSLSQWSAWIKFGISFN
ncbi:MAG: hypothetical protein NTX86_02410 [Candidatus Dependentiae bacterium]|nr:hypothetical protein [Candidatus Dependentiae bacterium]